ESLEIFWSRTDPRNTTPGGMAGANFIDLRRRAQSFSGMAAFRSAAVNVAGSDGAERIAGAVVSPDFFEVLQPRAIAGRTFVAADWTPGARLVVISEELWRKRFDGAADVVGKTITLNGEPATVTGVIASETRLPQSAELWMTSKILLPEHP